ncbi:MAG: DUF2510 domain-containing protein [Protaetiibacter sp.]
MESSNAPAAGWFPDPEDASSERWWSGHGWTDHTRPPLGTAVPAAFATQVDTLVATRTVPPQPEPFVFAMTSQSAGPVTPAARGHAAEQPVRSWYTTPEPPAAQPTPEQPVAALTALVPASAFVAPAPAPAAPAFVAPAAPPLAPAPSPVPTADFVLPGAIAVLSTPADEEATARIGRHADVVPEPPQPPVASAPRPVGYTASADPDVANRYRAIIHAVDQAPAAPVDLATGSRPAQQPASFPSSATSYTAPSYSGYASGSNRPARTALTSGLIGLTAAALVVASRLVGLGIPPEVLGLATLVLVALAFLTGFVAIVTGIVGLVTARRAGVGRGAAAGGLALGILLVVVLPAAFVALMFWLGHALGVLA